MLIGRIVGGQGILHLLLVEILDVIRIEFWVLNQVCQLAVDGKVGVCKSTNLSRKLHRVCRTYCWIDCSKTVIWIRVGLELKYGVYYINSCLKWLRCRLTWPTDEMTEAAACCCWSVKLVCVVPLGEVFNSNCCPSNCSFAEPFEADVETNGFEINMIGLGTAVYKIGVFKDLVIFAVKRLILPQVCLSGFHLDRHF